MIPGSAPGVTLVRSDTPLAARGEGGADVAVDAGSEQVSCTYEGASHSESFNGSGLHGRTFQLQIDQAIEKAFVFLPAEPKINTPSGQRPVGEGVMKVILVHELIHACGLTNADHCSDDLFNGFPSVDYGSRPAAHKVVIVSGGRRRSMPPLFLAGPTIRNIRSVWM